MNIDDEVRAWAAEHHHLITRAAWIGDRRRTSRSFDRAIHAGVLVRVDRNVAALAGTSLTPERRIAAAVLSYGRPCLVSHRSAAFLWGAPVRGTDPVDLLTTTGLGWSERTGLRIHRPTDLRWAHAVKQRGIEVTAPLRTLADLGAVDRAAVGPTLEAMLIAGLVTVPTVERTIALHRKRGRPGLRALEAAVVGLPLGRKPPDSVLEPAAARVFANAGIRGWTFHPRALGYELDFGFLAERVDVEVDGWTFHRSPASFEGDRRRDAALVAAGWAVLRFTWRQVNRQAAWVGRTVVATLAQRSPRG